MHEPFVIYGTYLKYPETDGQPMAENTLQFEWIVLIKLGLEAAFFDRDDIFIAGDLFWYPVEGRVDIRLAPDVMVAIGRPKGHRRSYLQWFEDNIPPQIAIEILSPGNRQGEMLRKFKFYQQYGVQEYYIYDPQENILTGYHRINEQLKEIPDMRNWKSPLLGIQFEWREKTLKLYQPDGKPFLSYLELREARQKAELAVKEALQKLEKEQQRAEQEKQRAEQEKQKAELLAQKLREMGIDPDQVS